MPLPLLLLGLVTATGLFGTVKSIKAHKDYKKAKEANSDANAIINSARQSVESARGFSRRSIDDLGRKKLDILHGTVSEFVESFSKLKAVEFRDSAGLKELGKVSIDRHELKELKESGDFATSVLTGLGQGALSGALTAFGAYGAAGAFASASTGTTIASLSGAAATNATLAFFGGGSLAAGGLGVAGGTMVLGALVAGPALAVMGLYVGSKASTELNKAKENLAKAKKTAGEIRLAYDMCIAIVKRADMFRTLLIRMDKYTAPLLKEMKKAIAEHGNNYEAFSLEQKKSVAACVASIQALKAVIDTPILTKNGNLTAKSYDLIKIAAPEKIISQVVNKPKRSAGKSTKNKE